MSIGSCSLHRPFCTGNDHIWTVYNSHEDTIRIPFLTNRISYISVRLWIKPSRLFVLRAPNVSSKNVLFKTNVFLEFKFQYQLFAVPSLRCMKRKENSFCDAPVRVIHPSSSFDQILQCRCLHFWNGRFLVQLDHPRPSNQITFPQT